MKRNKLKTLALTLALISLGAILPNKLLINANADEWKLKDNSWHLLDTQGKEKTGWQQVDGRWYYLNDDGSVAASKWIKSRGKWYYLGSTGAMVTNNTVDNCELGLDGAWITNVGIDNELTEQLRNIFVYHTCDYKGVKISEFNSTMFQVADGTLSEQEATSKINKMKWTEEAKAIDSYYNGVADISSVNAIVEKFNVAPGKTAKEISNECFIKPGGFCNLVAYRNSDNSITITSLSCNFSVSNIRK